MSFRVKTSGELLQTMVNRVVARSSLNDVNEGSDLLQVLAAVSRVVEQGYVDMSRLLSLFSVDKASGADLDLRAKDYLPEGLERRGALHAQTVLRFVRQAGASPIPLPAATRVARIDPSP